MTACVAGSHEEIRLFGGERLERRESLYRSYGEFGDLMEYAHVESERAVEEKVKSADGLVPVDDCNCGLINAHLFQR
jgi:hypothetical protein